MNQNTVDNSSTSISNWAILPLTSYFPQQSLSHLAAGVVVGAEEQHPNFALTHDRYLAPCGGRPGDGEGGRLVVNIGQDCL